MEDYELGTICYKRVKRHDESSSVWLQSSGTLVASSQLPAADSSSLQDDFDSKAWRDIYEYYKLKHSCNLLKQELHMYDTCWKCAVPSLALWCHMKSLDYNSEDIKSLRHRGVDPEDKMTIVEKALKKQRRVKLEFYDMWSEEYKEFLSYEDHLVPPPSGFGGKLIDETPDGTTIYIGRRVFENLVAELMVELGKFSTLGKWSMDAYALLNDSMTMVDTLNPLEIRHLCDIRAPFRDILVHMKNVMEPKYHWFIRKEQEDTLRHVWAYHTTKEKLRALVTFPFHVFRGYSERIRELFETKVAGSELYRTTRYIIEQHRKFMSSPKDMEKKLESESGSASFMSLSGDSGDILRQMCTKSLEEFKKVQEHCTIMENFSNSMVRLIEIPVTDKPLSEKLDDDIAHLMNSQCWLSNDGNLEELRTLLEAFRGKWMDFFGDLSLDYVVLGILLYRDGAALTGDQRKVQNFISKKVEFPMMAKRSYLLQIWRDSFYDEKVCLEFADPARVVLSSCIDDKIEFPKCEDHNKSLLDLQFQQELLEKVRCRVPAKALESGFHCWQEFENSLESAADCEDAAI